MTRVPGIPRLVPMVTRLVRGCRYRRTFPGRWLVPSPTTPFNWGGRWNLALLCSLRGGGLASTPDLAVCIGSQVGSCARILSSHSLWLSSGRGVFAPRPDFAYTLRMGGERTYGEGLTTTLSPQSMVRRLLLYGAGSKWLSPWGHTRTKMK